MVRNYLKVALRTLRKNKIFSLINVSGLALGMACCVLIFLNVLDELSFDKFQQHYDDIYRVVMSNTGASVPNMSIVSYPVGPALKRDFPEVLEAARFRSMGRVLLRNQEKRFYETIFFADSTAFNIFSFAAAAGDPNTALTQPNSIVITEEMADKYFGDEGALGKTLSADLFNTGEWQDLRVTAVLQNIPKNSHFRFDFLVSMQNDLTQQQERWDNVFMIYTYILLPSNYDPGILQAKLEGYVKKYEPENPWYTLHLQPMKEIRLHSKLSADQNPGDITYVVIFSAIAVLILLIACINFMNLSTARSSQRAKEVGVRKVVGAFRYQLIRQFLSEAILMSMTGGLVALALVELFLPAFNYFSGKELSLTLADRGVIALVLSVLSLIVGLLSGSYPAFVLSSFYPSEVLKGKFRKGEVGVLLRKGLVVFQFAASIALIFSTAVIHKQMQFVRNKNLGLNAEQVLAARLNDEARQNYQALKSELQSHPRILSIAASSGVPTSGNNWTRFRIAAMEQLRGMMHYSVDEEFIKTYGIELAAGRNFHKGEVGQSQPAVFLLNQTAVELAESSTEEVLGARLEMEENGSGMVIGTLKDFHVSSMRVKVQPIILIPGQPENFSYVSIKLRVGDLPATMSFIEKTWQKLVPTYPLNAFFVDDKFERLYETDRKLGNIMMAFAGLAVFVACLGLLGLAGQMAEYRTKEIGVRKVLGATLANVVVLLSRDFTKWVLVANLIAWPAGYFAMNKWLQDFAYRTEIGLDAFLLAGAMTFLIALLTVSYHAVKTALTNPAQSLRYE